MIDTPSFEDFTKDRSVEGWLLLVATVLASLTGLFNLVLFYLWEWPPDLIAGVAYFVGIGLHYYDFHRRRLYVIGAILTLAQIIWFYAVGTEIVYGASNIQGYFFVPIHPPWMGILDKIVQGLLVITLVIIYRTDSTPR